MATAVMDTADQSSGLADAAPTITPSAALRVGAEFPAVGISLAMHMLVVMLLAFVPMAARSQKSSELVASLEELESLEQPLEIAPSIAPPEEIGANSTLGEDAALATATMLAEVSALPSQVDAIAPEEAQFDLENLLRTATGVERSTEVVRGSSGQGVTGAEGAVDQITDEILRSLDERRTLVVWIFDQSVSMVRQRDAVMKRFEGIYTQLGVLRAAGKEQFTKYGDQPLLTAVMSFGQQVDYTLEKPTENFEELKEAVAGIPVDNSGIERVFSAVYLASQKYKPFRDRDPNTKEPKRNVLMIVVSDEAGEDIDGMEKTITQCRRLAMPVYVIGVPAPFGRKTTLIKYVDPDPKFDQSAQWAQIDQGPESLLPERLALDLNEDGDDRFNIDSGFGPFALTRLCYETGGVYYTVHPNRSLSRMVRRSDIDDFASHLSFFFDSSVMRAYRPDYVSAAEYMKRVKESKLRSSLVQASQLSASIDLNSPNTRFLKVNEGNFANALLDAQKAAARIEPTINMIFEVLKNGEVDRAKETTPRWQAGYDLAYGRILAIKTRVEGYNAMLAIAKSRKFDNPKSNTLVLAKSKEINGSSQLKTSGKKALELLTKVIDEHPDTPWALLAQRELADPLGWKWTETFTDLTPPPAARPAPAGNPPPAPPRSEQARMLEKPKEKRPIPKL
jgi:hypothetical protein